MESRSILLVDCDTFYVQVARLGDPGGAGREPLLIVGGSPSGRGVVTSASYPVRAYGVHAGMPTAQALRLCPEAKVVPVARQACVEKSRQVRRVLDSFSPVVQAASIDEFYVDLTGTERIRHFEPLETTAWTIRERVLDATEISVSIGGGTRKLIAKLAAGRAKPAGVHIVPPGEEPAFMRTFDLREIPGVGPALAETLESRGLVRVSDLLPLDEQWLARWLGPSRGRWLWERARGWDRSSVEPREPRKSLSSERTFPSDLYEDAVLEAEILALAGTVGAGLRKEGLQARTVTVKIRDEDFTTRQASHTLPDPVESDPALFAVARSLLRELRQRRHSGTRLLGVAASGLMESRGPPQLDLFSDPGGCEPAELRAVSRVLDDIRQRFGEDAIRPGRLLERRGNHPQGGGRGNAES